jgi:glucosamine-6-phosphate deaminase
MVTRKDAAGDFFGEENVPERAITMGIGTILSARKICLLSFGEHKAGIIKRAVKEPVAESVAASFLQEHPNAVFYIDTASAAELTRFATPWLVGNCIWDDLLERKAVVWLSQEVQKPILKLESEDYNEHGLSNLLHMRGKVYDINLRVFKKTMNTITGWPAGKENKKRVLVLSPHPDDDVICMGGTLMRLVEQGHEVHTAYMVSGSLSVFDHNVLRHARFVKAFNDIFDLTGEQAGKIEEHVEKFLQNKLPGEADPPEVQDIKALIRRTEAIAASHFCGIKDESIHFLDMPFYHSGRVQKLSISDEDISVAKRLLEEVKPDMIFAAGDMSDPHGTHRLCLEAFLTAFELYSKKQKVKPEIWLYRGAWQEWKPEEIDMAVPLSPDEQSKKRFAIFRHESQKDRAMFPGPYDSREFWQRAEDRNRSTADIYDSLGLPEYQAIEAFVKYPLKLPEQIKKQLQM